MTSRRTELIASVSSLTTEMQELTKEIEAIESQLTAKPELEAHLKEIAKEEQSLAARSKTAKQRKRNFRS